MLDLLFNDGIKNHNPTLSDKLAYRASARAQVLTNVRARPVSWLLTSNLHHRGLSPIERSFQTFQQLEPGQPGAQNVNPICLLTLLIQSCDSVGGHPLRTYPKGVALEKDE